MGQCGLNERFFNSRCLLIKMIEWYLTFISYQKESGALCRLLTKREAFGGHFTMVGVDGFSEDPLSQIRL